MIPILFIIGGVAVLSYVLFSDDDEAGPVPDHQPDYDPTPVESTAEPVPGSGVVSVLPKSGYKKVDAMMPELVKASQSSGIPLGLLVGWVAKESGGRIDEKPRALKGEPDGERGYFQLTPSESRGLGLEHTRLSVDPVYSINAGLALIGKYMKNADTFGVAPKGSSYYWRIVKLGHTMGSGSTKIIVNGAKAAGQAGSWEELERHALSNEDRYKKATKHSPKKWFPLIKKIYVIGKPFGFGDEDSTQVVGVGGAGPAYDDIPDVLELLPNRGRR